MHKFAPTADMLFYICSAGENAQNNGHNAVRAFVSLDYTLQEAEENQSTLIKRCRGGGVWVRVVYPISHTRAWAHVCMSAVPPSPTQERKHHSEVSADAATLKRIAVLQKRCLTFDVTEGQFVGAQRSMRVPSFNTLHTWKGPATQRKGAKKCPESLRLVWNAPLSVLLAAVTHMWKSKWCKTRDRDPLAKWRQSHAWKSVRHANSHPLIGQANFSSISQGRFLFKKRVIFSNGRLASRSCGAATNPVERLYRMEGLRQSCVPTVHIRQRAGCRICCRRHSDGN